MMKGRSIWEVSMWAGASLGAGTCLEKSMSPLVGEAQRVRECRTQSLEEACTLVQRQRTALPEPRVTKANTVRQFPSAVEKLPSVAGKFQLTQDLDSKKWCLFKE